MTLPSLEAEDCDEDHRVTTDRIQLVKLYPDGEPSTRMQLRGMGRLYFCCNRHGLMRCRP